MRLLLTTVTFSLLFIWFKVEGDTCSVPMVNHGIVGKKVGPYKLFQKIPVGGTVEEEEELYLRCEDKYEAFGKPKKEDKIFCKGGELSEFPQCLPAHCSQAPPPTANATIGSVNRAHGGGVVYLCKRQFTKVKFENVLCDFGTWKGDTPVCKESNCIIYEIANGAFTEAVEKKEWKIIRYERRTEYEKIRLGRTKSLGSSVYVTCDAGYSFQGRGGNNVKVQCSYGEWNEQPVCLITRCSLDDLPFQGLVQPRKRFYSHNEGFKASCQKGYYQTIENNNIFCDKGIWKGHFPPCTPASCDLENLSRQEGMASDNKGIVQSGISVQVNCEKGFSPSQYRAHCSKGDWTVTEKLCEQSNCFIYELTNGAFTEAVEKKKWKIISYERWTEYEKIRLGRTKSPGSTVYVTCDAEYSFQGRGSNNVKVQCSYGEWNEQPVCLITGTPNRKRNETTTNKSTTEIPTVRNATSTRIPFSAPVSDLTVPEANSESQSTSSPTCFCTYTGFDQNLVAYVGTKLLQNGSQVENGSSVKFYCQAFGYLRLQGLVEITCQSCRWQPSKFPECVQPKIGETTLFISGDWKLLPGGIVGITKGKIVSILCDVKGVELSPQWNNPVVSSIYVESYQDFYTERNVSMLYILKTDVEHSGVYQCFVPGYAPYVIRIEIIPDNSDVATSAMLVSTNSPDGTVRDNSDVATSAILVSTNSPDGTVRVSTCLVDSLFNILPENVIPDMETVSSEDVPFNSSITLKCEDGFMPNGPDKAKCGQNGVWKVSKVQCITGCSYPLKSQDSELIIEPNKEFYRLGELITLSCPTGQALSTEVVRLLCLNMGWSQNDLPRCINI